MSARRDSRRSWWAIVSYESREVIMAGLLAAHVSCAIGPVHDRDLWGPEDVFAWIRSRPKGTSIVLADDTRVDKDGLTIAQVGHAVFADVPKEGHIDVPQLLEPKKAHTHILLRYPHPVALDAVLDSLKGYLPATSYAEPVGSPVAYYRYLTHMDTPSKTQYSADDIICIGDVTSALGEREDDAFAASKRIMEYVLVQSQVHRTITFKDLVLHYVQECDDSAVREIRAHGYYYRQLI